MPFAVKAIGKRSPRGNHSSKITLTDFVQLNQPKHDTGNGFAEEALARTARRLFGNFCRAFKDFHDFLNPRSSSSLSSSSAAASLSTDDVRSNSSRDLQAIECRCYPFGSGCFHSRLWSIERQADLTTDYQCERVFSYRAQDGSWTASDIARCEWKTSRCSDLFIADKVCPQ